MKLLKIDYNYYSYPDGISNIDELLDYISEKINSFIKVTMYRDDECVPPYFVKDDTGATLLNISQISSIEEIEATVLSRQEYDERLHCVVSEKCVDCVNYIDHSQSSDNLEGHRGHISLDGKCNMYEKNKD